MLGRIWAHAWRSKPLPKLTMVLKSRSVLVRISQQSLLRLWGRSNERDFELISGEIKGFGELAGCGHGGGGEEEEEPKRKRGRAHGILTEKEEEPK